MTDEERALWQSRYPEWTTEQIELTGCIVFNHEIRKRLTGPTDWMRDPETLLLDLRNLELWRAEIITDNPIGVEEYEFKVHREKSVLFTLLKGAVQEMIVNLRAVKSTTQLPVCPDRLERFARTVEAVHCGADDAQSVYELSRILSVEIQTMEAFCKIETQKRERLVTADQVALFLGILRTSLSKKEKDWPTPEIDRGGSTPKEWKRCVLLPVLEQQYPKKDWSKF